MISRACSRAALCIGLLLLVGCVSGPSPREKPAPVSAPSGEAAGAAGSSAATGTTATTGADTPVTIPRAPADAGKSAAHEALLERAFAARAAGDMEAAFSLLERAQRIDPGNARIYMELARTHQQAGDATQARAMAERGMLYCLGSECRELQLLLDLY